MSTNDKINSKRQLNQLQNVEDRLGEEDSSQQLGEKTKKKQKRTTSLQGRPAKASTELRKMEEEIKKAAWRTAELEECLYLVYGGAQATHDSAQQTKGIQLIKQYFNSKIASENFREMLEEWKRLKTELMDPLGKEYVPLSDRYFIDQYLTKQIEKGIETVEILDFLIIYAFQIFLRTNIQGFEFILKVLLLVYENSEENGEVGINTSLNPDTIFQKVEPSIEDKSEKEKFKVISDSFHHFNDRKKEIIIIKSQKKDTDD